MALETDAQRRWFFAHLNEGMRRVSAKMLEAYGSKSAAPPSQAVSIPASRPYLDPKMKPSEMMRAYVIKTWGSDFGQNDLIDAVVNAAAKEGFVPGRPTRRGGPRVKTLGDQKRNVLNWMDWNDKGLRGK